MQRTNTIIFTCIEAKRIGSGAIYYGAVQDIVPAAAIVINQSKARGINIYFCSRCIRIIRTTSFISGKLIYAFVINDDPFHATCNVNEVSDCIQRLKIRLREINVKINRCRSNLVSAFFTPESENCYDSNHRGNALVVRYASFDEEFLFQDIKLF